MCEVQEYKIPEISVIIPIYNRERFVRPLIEYLRKQSFRDYECIIVDDGSTDHTGSLCDSLTADDKRFIIRHTANLGVSHARNLALDIAKGTYITFVDSDDIIPEDYLEKLYVRIKTGNADMIIGSFCRIYPSDNKMEKIEYPYKDCVYSMDQLLPDFAVRQKENGVYGRCFAKIFPRKYASNVRFDEKIKLAEDFDFYLRIYPRIKNVLFDNTCEYGYYDGAENSSVCVKDNEIDYIAQLQICLRYKHFLKMNNCYADMNRTIVDEQIKNYLFFSVFHCDIEHLRSRLNTVRKYYKCSGVSVADTRGLKGFVLRCIHYNREKELILVMAAYRFLRRLLKGY